MRVALAILSASVLLGCGGASSPDDLLAKYRLEGSLLPTDNTGNTLRFTSVAKYQEFSKALSEQGYDKQQEVATQTDSPNQIQGITTGADFTGCRGELTRDTYSGLPPNWKFYTARTMVTNVYKRGDGWGAEVIAQVALPNFAGMIGSWVNPDLLYNGYGYDPLVKDYGAAIVSMDGTEHKSRHACGWASSDLECKYWICVDHERRRHEDWTAATDVFIK